MIVMRNLAREMQEDGCDASFVEDYLRQACVAARSDGALSWFSLDADGRSCTDTGSASEDGSSGSSVSACELAVATAAESRMREQAASTMDELD